MLLCPLLGVFSYSSLTRAFRGGGDRTVTRKAQSHLTQDGSAFFCKHGLLKPVWGRGQNRGRESKQARSETPLWEKNLFLSRSAQQLGTLL